MFRNIFKRSKDTNPYTKLIHDADKTLSVEQRIHDIIATLSEALNKPVLRNPNSMEINVKEYMDTAHTQIRNAEEQLQVAKITVEKTFEEYDDFPEALETRTNHLFKALHAIISQMKKEIKECLKEIHATTDEEEKKTSLFGSCYKAGVYMTGQIQAETKEYLETVLSHGRNSLKDEMTPVLEEQKKKEVAAKDT